MNTLYIYCASLPDLSMTKGFVSRVYCFIRDRPVDLVRGGGGGEWKNQLQKKICRAPKGQKKICTRNIVKKKLQSKTSNVVIVQSILFEYFQKKITV